MGVCGSGLRPPPHTPSLSLDINQNVRLGNFQMVLSGEISVDDDTSLAVGGGADFPLFLGFKLRATGDYLGNSKAPSTGSAAPGHYRFGVGVAYHF